MGISIFASMEIFIFIFSRCTTACKNENTSSTCCPSYRFVNGICIDCPLGYFGPNCAYSCPYPSYGHRCLQKCMCDKDKCDISFGCASSKQLPSDIASLITTNIPKSKNEYTSGQQSLNNSKHPEENGNGPKEIKNGSAAVIAVISVIGVLVISLLVTIIIFQLRGKIHLRLQKSPNRGSNVTSQRHVDTYCEIDENEATEGACNMWSESEIYEQIDQSKKDGTKYTTLPPREGAPKKERAIMSTLSMQKILEADDDEDTCKTEVQMRKSKSNVQVPLNRTDKTSTQVSGYIDMNKEKELEDYVHMAAEERVSDKGSLSKD
ncbi:uncharacterized protein LOC125681366 [Ostrea edulis]|uniref:uncharacterized protein LOC125681366 n=1 Tax=Ostrea edulis TaxID=37623 RepID=UPI0024AF806C|nr:uncharacterized protein LOC125681366 [Ostrea edulis]